LRKSVADIVALFDRAVHGIPGEVGQAPSTTGLTQGIEGVEFIFRNTKVD
jgi:hypothetical protein